MAIEKPIRSKRGHGEEFKDDLVRTGSEPGVSVAGLALANGVKADLVRNRWMMSGD
jgi:transposase